MDAPHRRYRDPHHKPEVLYPTEPFELLGGFKEPEEILELLRGFDVRSLDPLREALAGPAGVRDAVGTLLTRPEAEVVRLVDEVDQYCSDLLAEGRSEE